MDNQTTAILMLSVILYSAVYAWVCAHRFVQPARPQSDAHVLPNTAHPPFPSNSSSVPSVSSDPDPYDDV